MADCQSENLVARGSESLATLGGRDGRGLSLAYAGFGIVSEAMNQLAFGFHPLRSGFMATTALFMLYLFWRRHLITDQPAMPATGSSVSEGSH